MKKAISLNEAETLAAKLRRSVGLNEDEPVNTKVLLRKLNAIALFKPLMLACSGVSCKSESGKMFLLINSECPIGRQNFTIAHELYHLLYDENPKPHIMFSDKDAEEKNADIFASCLLLPKNGIIQMLSPEEIRSGKIELKTILRIEHMFEVSRSALIVRLKSLHLIRQSEIKHLETFPLKRTARLYGYDTSLYERGNENVIIGNYGEMARTLFEEGKISEGHYNEFMSVISYGNSQDSDSSGC